MQIGLVLPQSHRWCNGEALRVVAALAEERGFHSIWVAEHVVLFDEYASKYPYAADGKIPEQPNGEQR